MLRYCALCESHYSSKVAHKCTPDSSEVPNGEYRQPYTTGSLRGVRETTPIHDGVTRRRASYDDEIVVD